MFSKTKKLLVITMLFIITSIYFCANISVAKDKKYNYAKTAVYVRKKPTKKSKEFGLIYDGDKVIKLGTIDKWTIVEYKNKIAYIKSKYLSAKKPTYTTKSSPPGKFKSYMDYRCITAKSSSQYNLQQKATTDPKTGIRMIGNRYCVAVGSGFTNKIGTKLDLVMKSGKIIKCILADQKKDSETVNGHKQHSWDKSVCEFLVDTKYLPKIVKRNGDISYIPTFNGNIEKIRVYKERNKYGYSKN